MSTFSLSQTSTPEQDQRRSDIVELRPRTDGARPIDALAAEIAQLGEGTSLSFVLRLGEVVYRGLYRSTPPAQAAGLLGSAKSVTSLRRLAAHPLVSFKVTSLWRAVSVYELSLRLPQVMDAPSLNVSHLRAVLGLPTNVQEELLTQAARERWTKRVLEQRASVYRRAEAPRGRRPTSKLVAYCREVERLATRLSELSDEDLRLESSERSEAVAHLEQMRLRLAR